MILLPPHFREISSELLTRLPPLFGDSHQLFDSLSAMAQAISRSN